jgi:L,D-peptidoglycan transpeptidase YkuD (ErfK/YbiS/YcfS/YnhG family)
MSSFARVYAKFGAKGRIRAQLPKPGVGPRKLPKIMAKTLKSLRIRTRPGHRAWAVAVAGPQALPAALGRSGIRANKREGDGATPRGVFRPVRLWWRADRGRPPPTRLPVRRIAPLDAWCEDPADRRYNRPIELRPGQSGDRLTRTDHVYDLLIELDHNTRPRVAWRGSAVFIHVARPEFAPTAGCVAFARPTLRRLLARLGPRTRIEIR